MSMQLLSITMILVYTVLPVFLLIRIWNNKSNDSFRWLISIVSNGGFILYLFFIAGWPLVFTGYYMRYIVIFALPIAVTKSYFNTQRSFPKNISRRYFVNSFLTAIVALIPIGILVYVFMSSSKVPLAVDMEFPLKNGSYYILQGGNNQFINHHQEVSAQKYALDVIKLNRFGFRSKVFHPKSVKDYNIYGDVVYSPCDGIVVNVVDNYPDLKPSIMDPNHPAGNYVAIAMPSSETTLLLAHIQPGSFLVKEGDKVCKGQPLCKVGNSGNTSEPHLHIHIIKSGGDLLYEGTGMPMKFNDRFLIRNDRVHSFLNTQNRK